MPTYRVAVYRRIDDLACATVEIEHPSESPDADHEEIVAAAVAEANRRDEKDELDWDIGEGGVWDDIDPDPPSLMMLRRSPTRGTRRDNA
jgi:hypothetical protein